MPDTMRGRLLTWLKVPREPSPPPGDTARMRTFRASPRFLRYRIAIWAMKQVGAFGALLFGYLLLTTARVHTGLPVRVVSVIEIFAWLGFVAQLPFSYAVLRLDFEMRWYILTDHSLRIREGVLTVSEKTMTFANIQNIAIHQNPLQRIFGIADVTVRSAGGGSGGSGGGGKQEGKGANMHEAAFEGVDDAAAIRDLIRDRLRRYRDAGLGNPDERASRRPPIAGAAPTGTAVGAAGGVAPAVLAARELLNEARLLRGELAGRSV